MKRRTSKEAVGIWSGFALAPAKGADLVWRELSKAHDYYNALVRLDLDRRAMYRAARGVIGENLPAFDEAMGALNEQIKAEVGMLKAARGKARKRVEDPVASARITALKVERKALAEQIKLARAEVEAVYGAGDAEYVRRTAEKAEGNKAPRVRARTNVETLREMLTEPQWSIDWKLKAQIDYEANEAKKRLLSECGLTPGTYLLVQKAVEAAFAPSPDGRPKPDPAPKKSFVGEGRLGVQIHQLPVAALLAGTDPQIALTVSDRPPQGAKAQQRYGTLRMRITRDHQCVDFPVKLYRPLPADGIITQAWVRAERCGPRTRYEFQFVVESPQWVKSGAIKGAGTVAIDTGWRIMEGGLRVAYWMDDHGRHGQILVPEGVRKAVDYADSLRSKSDTHFNTARADLRAWMRDNPSDVPAWMPEATETISQWRAHWKLIHVAKWLTLWPSWFDGLWGQWCADRKAAKPPGKTWKQWRDERKTAADLDLFGSFAEVGSWLRGKYDTVPPLMQIAVYLNWWRRKDSHLYDWEMRERRYAENARTDMFRKVCQVARQYERVLIEKIDLPKFNKNASPEEKVNQEWLHRTGRIAAPGDLAARIMEACKGRAEKMSADANTCTCHKCAHVNTAWEHPERRVQTCAGCGAEWDRDENACRVMLARWHAPPTGERSGDTPAPAPARGTENTPDAGAKAPDRGRSEGPEQGRQRDRSQSGRQGVGMSVEIG
jgi:hypothetical protein